MNKQTPSITIKANRVSGFYLGNDRWSVIGRGPRRTVTHAELQQLINAKPRKNG